MENVLKIIFGILGVVGVLCFFGLLVSYPVMLLWNLCLVPAIPAILEISWLQAWGILVLSGFLFKSSTSE